MRQLGSRAIQLAFGCESGVIRHGTVTRTKTSRHETAASARSDDAIEGAT